MGTLRFARTLVLAAWLPCGVTVAQEADRPAPSAAPVPAAELVPAPEIRVGDRWVRRLVDLWSGGEIEVVQASVKAIEGGRAITELTVLRRNGEAVRQPRGDGGFDLATHTVGAAGRPGSFPTLQFPLFPGKRWSLDFSTTGPRGVEVKHERRAEVEGWEDVTVPAGTFRTLKVKHTQRSLRPAMDGIFTSYEVMTVWYAPQARNFARWEREVRDVRSRLTTRERRELLEYQLN